MEHTDTPKEKINAREFYDILMHENYGSIDNKEISNITTLLIGVLDLPRAKTIRNCDFVAGGVITQLGIKDFLKFENCTFKGGEFDIRNISGGRLEFDTGTLFHSKLSLSNLNTDFTNLYGNYEGEVNIHSGKGKLRIGSFIDNPSEFADLIIGNSAGFEEIYFVGLRHKGAITIQKETPKQILFLEGDYDNIVFQNVEDFNNVTFGDCERPEKPIINSLQIQNLNLTGKLNFYDVQIKNLDFSHLNNNNGDITFRSVNFTGDVHFEDSDLENIKFIDTDFHHAKLYFDRSVIDKVTFSNVTWTTKHSVESTLPETSKDERTRRFKILTEVYRQLKKNSLAEHDNIRALKFYRNEMNEYWNRIKLDKTESRWNRFLIRVNKVTSNFGQSYMQPLLWILIGQWVMCTMIWTLQAKHSCVVGTHCSSDFVAGLSQYFTWLVPIYRTPDSWTDGSKIVGVFMRIYNGFFIYHFIKVTRKFGKV